MGILWWTGGACGVFLTMRKKDRHRRNFFPALVIFLTGVAMANHHQHSAFSTTIHTFFGTALCAVGLSKLIEVAFVTGLEKGTEKHPYQLLPAFLLVLSGCMFMSAHEEQLHWLSTYTVIDTASYLNAIVSLAMVLFIYPMALCRLYKHLVSDSTTGFETMDSTDELEDECHQLDAIARCNYQLHTDKDEKPASPSGPMHYDTDQHKRSDWMVNIDSDEE